MTPINRKEAARLGLQRYFTGKPCKHGHVSERYVASKQCVSCASAACRGDDYLAQKRQYYIDNRSRILTQQAVYNAVNAERRSEWMRGYYAENREARLASNRSWKARNKDSVMALNLRRLARQRRAVPAWFGELDSLVWLEAADLVQLRFDATGIRWNADHMLALRASTVCGLHTWNNCQVIPASLNAKKKNKLALTDNLEWLQYI